MMRGLEQGNAHLSYAVGGSVSSISFEDHEGRDQVDSRTDNGWGIRGKVRGFSRTSRRNLLRRLASINRRAFRAFKVSSAWHEVCGKVSEGHLRAGTRVEQIRNWKKATSYAERYLAKEEEFPEGLETGRIWGIWSESLLPIQWETVEVSQRDAYKIRRIFRKLARRRGSGSLQRLTVFVRYENVVRLLQFLGYCLE